MNENQVEQFIDEVESRPAIWDSKSDKYSNKIEKKKAWEEICNIFIENFTNKTPSEKNEAILLQRKWKNLRDSYSRELNKQRASKSGSAASSHRKYQHFDQLQFLSCLSESRPTQPTAKKRKASEPEQDDTNKILKALLEKMQKKDESIENDGDRFFLLSLLSDFKKIPENRKTDAKYEMIGLIRRFINTHDNFSYSYQEHQGYFTSTNQSNQVLADSPTQESQLTDMSSIYENFFSESNDN